MIPVNEPLLDGNEKKYLNQCIDTGWISSEGPFVTEFEKGLASKFERKFGIAVCNGSVALDLAIVALGIGPGDEVILPTFTIISCAAAVVRAGATPIVVDSNPLTWNMTLEGVQSAFTEKTKAIMIVHIYGLPVDLDPILEFARSKNLKVIEDAAEMHGQTYKGKPCGSFGDVSTLSFYPNKHLTTGEGGMVLTNDLALADRCKSLRNLSFKPERRFVHDELGWNYRMTNLQAALGVAQLERLEFFVDKKRKMGKAYIERLKEIKEIQLPCLSTSYAENIFWVFGIVLEKEVPFDAAAAMKKLANKGIGTRPFFWPMHEQPVFLNKGMFKNSSYPVAENLARRGLYLPSGLAIKEEQIEIVSECLKKVIKEG